MSGPISDWLRESADNLRDAAESLRDQAEELLNDDSVINDIFAGDLMDQAASLEIQAGVTDGLADAAEWLGY